MFCTSRKVIGRCCWAPSGSTAAAANRRGMEVRIIWGVSGRTSDSNMESVQRARYVRVAPKPDPRKPMNRYDELDLLDEAQNEAELAADAMQLSGVGRREFV